MSEWYQGEVYSSVEQNHILIAALYDNNSRVCDKVMMRFCITVNDQLTSFLPHSLNTKKSATSANNGDIINWSLLI